MKRTYRILFTVVLLLFACSLSVSAAEKRQKLQLKRKKAAPSSFTDPTTGMAFILVKGGCYEMGDTFGDGYDTEKPVHKVCVDDFYMGKYEVTQGEWQKVMGNNPSNFSSCGANCPVEQVSWNDTQEYVERLNSASKKAIVCPPRLNGNMPPGVAGIVKSMPVVIVLTQLPGMMKIVGKQLILLGRRVLTGSGCTI